jgi:hypothetical protein
MLPVPSYTAREFPETEPKRLRVQLSERKLYSANKILPRIPDEEGVFMAKELKVGQKAPDFTLEAGDGKKVKLSDFKGKKIVLYFYPRDNTPG